MFKPLQFIRLIGLPGVLVSSVVLGGLSPTLAQPQPQASLAKSAQQGFSLLERGLVNQAIREFEQTLQRTPQSLEANLGLAIAYQRAGRDADAFRGYQQVIRLDPDNSTALRALGTLGGYRPEWQAEGIEALTKLLQANPRDQSALAQRALLYSYQGQFGEAVADYAIVLQSDPSPETLLSAAEAFTYGGYYREGLELFTRYQSRGRSIQGSPTIAYALAEREVGNPAQAIQVLETSLQQARETDSVTLQQRGALAASYAANGQFYEAEAALAPLIGRSDSRLTLARAYNELWRHSRNVEYGNAAASLYQAILAQPSQYVTISIAREVAYALGGLPGQQALALEVYRQLTAKQSDDVGLLVQRAVVERQLGYLSPAEFQQQMLRYAQPLPADAIAQRQIAQGLVRLDPPEPNLLPLYQVLVNNGVQEPLLNYRIAQIYVGQQNYPAARAALVAYSENSPGTSALSNGLLLLADIERREGDLAASAQIYDAILLNQPTDQAILTAALQGYGEILESQGRSREALALYDQLMAQSAQPTTAQILHRTRLAYLAGAMAKVDAKTVLERSFLENAAVEPADYFAQGELALELQAFELAEQAYNTLLSAQPNNTSVLMALAGLRYAQQHYNEARDLYNQVLTQEPNNQSAQAALVSLSQGYLYRRGFQPSWERY